VGASYSCGPRNVSSSFTFLAIANPTGRDWLLAELGAATEILGRTRKFSYSAERARRTVGWAIRRAIARVTDADGVIRAHQSATVDSGTRCADRSL
jgi:hypothetical protein